MNIYVIGNGLSIDLRNNYYPLKLEQWDTSRPLSWKISDPVSGRPLLGVLSRLNNALCMARQQMPNNVNDFSLIGQVVKMCEPIANGSSFDPEYFERGLLRTEVYDYLSIAFASYDKIVRGLDFSSWKWFQYFQTHLTDSDQIISFNYDLVIEHIIERSGNSIYAIGVQEDQHGIYVGKPHGSIDYEVGIGTISLSRELLTLPPNNVICLNDTKIKRLGINELDQIRTQCELVPPRETSKVRSFQWVAPIFSYGKTLNLKVESLFLLGHSYALEDRKEIDELLDTLGPGTKVIVANPVIKDELKDAIYSRKLLLTHWPNGPEFKK